MDELRWARYQKEAKDAETVRNTLLELYPGCFRYLLAMA